MFYLILKREIKKWKVNIFESTLHVITLIIDKSFAIYVHMKRLYEMWLLI